MYNNTTKHSNTLLISHLCNEYCFTTDDTEKQLQFHRVAAFHQVNSQGQVTLEHCWWNWALTSWHCSEQQQCPNSLLESRETDRLQPVQGKHTQAHWHVHWLLPTRGHGQHHWPSGCLQGHLCLLPAQPNQLTHATLQHPLPHQNGGPSDPTLPLWHTWQHCSTAYRLETHCGTCYVRFYHHWVPFSFVQLHQTLSQDHQLLTGLEHASVDTVYAWNLPQEQHTDCQGVTPVHTHTAKAIFFTESNLPWMKQTWPSTKQPQSMAQTQLCWSLRLILSPGQTECSHLLHLLWLQRPQLWRVQMSSLRRPTITQTPATPL